MDDTPDDMAQLAQLERLAIAHGIPDYMRDGLLRWINFGIAPGGFLRAVLRNDLRNAFEHADDMNRDLMASYLRFLYTAAPAACWGSAAKFDKWPEIKGRLVSAEEFEQDRQEHCKHEWNMTAGEADENNVSGEGPQVVLCVKCGANGDS